MFGERLPVLRDNFILIFRNFLTVELQPLAYLSIQICPSSRFRDKKQ